MKLELSDAQFEIYYKAYAKAAAKGDYAAQCWRLGMQAVLASVAAAQAVPAAPGVVPHGEHVLDFKMRPLPVQEAPEQIATLEDAAKRFFG